MHTPPNGGGDEVCTSTLWAYAFIISEQSLHNFLTPSWSLPSKFMFEFDLLSGFWFFWQMICDKWHSGYSAVYQHKIMEFHTTAWTRFLTNEGLNVTCASCLNLSFIHGFITLRKLQSFKPKLSILVWREQLVVSIVFTQDTATDNRRSFHTGCHFFLFCFC